MESIAKTQITVQAKINAPLDQVWKCWISPEDIVCWNHASEDWQTTYADNYLEVGGKFNYRMEAKNGSFGFDFWGIYNKVIAQQLIEITLGDERKMKVSFFSENGETEVVETFEAESENSVELQRTGWQAILDNFKKYVESLVKMERLHFEISINAPAAKVYETMLGERNYSEWTAVFNPTSRFEGSWEKGSKIRFIGTDEDGNIGGMVGQIKENIPNKYVSIEYLAIILKNKEVTSGPELEGWIGALENYTFNETNGKTILEIELDSNLEFIAYFKETWPKALDVLKTICED